MLVIVSCIAFTFNILGNHTRPYLTLKQSFQVKQGPLYPMIPHIDAY